MYGCLFGRFTNLPFLAVPLILWIYPPNQDGGGKVKVAMPYLEMIDTGHGSIKLPISGGAETMVKKYRQKRKACLQLPQFFRGALLVSGMVNDLYLKSPSEI